MGREQLAALGPILKKRDTSMAQPNDHTSASAGLT